MKTICIFGDSITHGVFDEEMGGWANRLLLYFWSEWEKYFTEVYHLGINGDTTDGLLRRFNFEAKARNPDIVIFAIGINDSIYYSGQNFDDNNDAFKLNLEILIKEARLYTDKIVFVGLTNVDENKVQPYPESETVGNYSNDKIDVLDNIIEKVCGDSKIYYVKIKDLLSHEDLHDGLHPNAKGHQKIFEKMKDFLVESKIV